MTDDLLERLQEHQADIARALRCIRILAVAENTTATLLMDRIIEHDDESATLSQ
jgi:hypothetical protein